MSSTSATETNPESEAGPSSSKDDKVEAGPSNAKEDIEPEDEEEPSNLQLAWEMFELAKEIFLKHAASLEGLDPVRLRLEKLLDETYLSLGEVSIENENYEQAIDDFKTCLKRRQELLPRVIADKLLTLIRNIMV